MWGKGEKGRRRREGEGKGIISRFSGQSYAPALPSIILLIKLVSVIVFARCRAFLHISRLRVVSYIADVFLFHLILIYC